jgi:hypothetical protein
VIRRGLFDRQRPRLENSGRLLMYPTAAAPREVHSISWVKRNHYSAVRVSPADRTTCFYCGRLSCSTPPRMVMEGKKSFHRRRAALFLLLLRGRSQSVTALQGYMLLLSVERVTYLSLDPQGPEPPLPKRRWGGRETSR